MIYNKEIIDKIKDSLCAKQLTVSVAESVTSGHLQAAFSTATDASKFFQGGITAYNAGQKCRHLNIEPISALANDCVSEKVASEMSVNVNALFISDYGIAITGYASKAPEKGIEKLYAYVAISRKDELLLTRKLNTAKEGVEAQVDYTNQVLKEFAQLLLQ